jgi:predicted nucleic-acid-binding protein
VIGLDTNVLVRLVTRDDDQQASKARLLLGRKSTERYFVNRVTIVELVWVLESAYGYASPMIAEAIDVLLDLDAVTVEDASVIRRAARLYRSGAGFADALVAESNVDHSCRATLTFDRAAAKKLPNMELIP